jgi:catechol 2,3-dioxygenase-like lactoylglutathione lyase family enzyme
VIGTPNPDRAVALYGARLGLDFRLDRTNPQWGSRLMFFRAGGAVVEIGAKAGAEASDGPDRLSGLAWRVTDPDAVQARLAKAGFDVSEVRTGRKPGTKIFTVRSGVVGAPTVMLSAEPASEDA